MKTQYDDPTFLFELRYRLSGGHRLRIMAHEAGQHGPHHTKVTVKAWLDSMPIFQDAYIGVPGHQTIDGKRSKELATNVIAMRPGDTDSDYFANYTPEQLEFAAAHGEELSLLALDRYGEP